MTFYSRCAEEISTLVAIGNYRTVIPRFAGRNAATTLERYGHTRFYEANQMPNHTALAGLQHRAAWRVANALCVFIKAQSETGVACERVPWKLRQFGGSASCTAQRGRGLFLRWLVGPVAPLRPRLQTNSWAQRSELNEKHRKIGFSTGRKRFPPNEGRRDRVINVTLVPSTAGRVGRVEGKSTRPAQTTYCAEVLGLIASDLNYK